MNAKTRILIQQDNFRHWDGRYAGMKDGAKRWTALVRICKSYAAQGLDYSTRIDTDAHTLTVTASGTPTNKERARAVKPKPYRDRGAPLTVKQARAKATEASRLLTAARDHVRNRITSGLQEPYGERRDTPREPEHRATQQRIGHGLARIIARGGLRGKPTKQDYAELDALIGRPVTKLSKLRKHDRESSYRVFIMRHYAGAQMSTNHWRGTGEKAPASKLMADFRAARGDLEFCRDMLTLAEEREQSKRGPSATRELDAVQEYRIAA